MTGLHGRVDQGKEFEFQRPYESYVMENILFKISFPAEFHAQVSRILHPPFEKRDENG